MKVAPDHVHIFFDFPPKYSVAYVVWMLKSISVSEVFKEFFELGKELYGGMFLDDWYFFRIGGDRVTEDLIHRYIKYHRDEVHVARWFLTWGYLKNEFCSNI